MTPFVYKIFRLAEWQFTNDKTPFSGSHDDKRDGFIHFSTRAQLQGTLDKHFTNELMLVIAAYETTGFPASQLLWEKSRDDALFPHLYGTIPANMHLTCWQLTRKIDTNFDLSALSEETGHGL